MDVAPPEVDLAPAASAAVLVKVYGSGPSAVRALNGVTVEIEARRFTAIMGPSGSGKSTLLHCLAGLDVATSGTVELGGTALGVLSDRELTVLRRERVGFVFQAYNLMPTLTVEQNIVLPLDLAGTKPDEAWVESLIQVLGLSDRRRHRPSELSGGQQQRVAVARALATRPVIVFADEPTGNLDSRTGAEVLGFLRRSVRELGQTIVMVTHNPVAAAYADRVILMADGRTVGEIHQPTPETVLDALRDLGA